MELNLTRLFCQIDEVIRGESTFPMFTKSVLTGSLVEFTVPEEKRKGANKLNEKTRTGMYVGKTEDGLFDHVLPLDE
jgi:hypothetical protein